MSTLQPGDDLIYMQYSGSAGPNRLPATFVHALSNGRIKIRLTGEHLRPDRCVKQWSVRRPYAHETSAEPKP